MLNRILIALMVALVTAVALPSSAEAGRKVRLMYEPPVAASGGPAVAVTFEDAREEKKGGKEPHLIAQERNQYGMPLGIFSGGSGTADPPEVVPAWVADVLRSAGYDARVGEDASLPRVHVTLNSVWGDGANIMGVERHTFTLDVEFSVFPAGAAEAVHTFPVSAKSGVTTVIMRFNDKFEAGFVRGITGTIVLGPDAKPPAGGRIFVIARRPGVAGGPPAATAALPARLPAEFSLGPQNVMMGGPFPDTVELTVRWDADGDAMTKGDADLWGTADSPVDKGTAGVEVVLH